MTGDLTHRFAGFLPARGGYASVEPPVVHPASVFVELAGEDLRRRLYLTSADDGTELALRPDYTIPVCLHHLATGAAKRKANYAYLGPVFRMRPGESGEFRQAGVESLGRTDRCGVLILPTRAEALAFPQSPDLSRRQSAPTQVSRRRFRRYLPRYSSRLDLNLPWRRAAGTSVSGDYRKNG